MTLTAKQQRFVDEYLVDLNATRAYQNVYGVSPTVASVNGSRLLANAKVSSAVSERQQALQDETNVTQARVIEELWSIATADPNELIEHRRGACRYCHGVGHQYQRTLRERDADYAGWLRAQKKAKPEDEVEPFNEAGGIGYNQTLPPAPDCPECYGEGQGYALAKDTRHLSPAARRLYAGIKETKEGLEVKLHDKVTSLKLIGQHIGMFRGETDPDQPKAGERFFVILGGQKVPF